MQNITNAVTALLTGIMAGILFYHFYKVKDGIARLMLLVFFGCIGLWSLFRAIALLLYVHKIIDALTIQAVVSYGHYLIYVPVLFSFVYLAIKRK